MIRIFSYLRNIETSNRNNTDEYTRFGLHSRFGLMPWELQSKFKIVCLKQIMCTRPSCRPPLRLAQPLGARGSLSRVKVTVHLHLTTRLECVKIYLNFPMYMHGAEITLTSMFVPFLCIHPFYGATARVGPRPPHILEVMHTRIKYVEFSHCE
jgi:hypothetical protein